MAQRAGLRGYAAAHYFGVDVVFFFQVGHHERRLNGGFAAGVVAEVFVQGFGVDGDDAFTFY